MYHQLLAQRLYGDGISTRARSDPQVVDPRLQGRIDMFGECHFGGYRQP